MSRRGKRLFRNPLSVPQQRRKKTKPGLFFFDVFQWFCWCFSRSEFTKNQHLLFRHCLAKAFHLSVRCLSAALCDNPYWFSFWLEDQCWSVIWKPFLGREESWQRCMWEQIGPLMACVGGCRRRWGSTCGVFITPDDLWEVRTSSQLDVSHSHVFISQWQFPIITQAPALEKADKRGGFSFLCAAENHISIWPQVPSKSTGDEFAPSVYTVNSQPISCQETKPVFHLGRSV